MYPMGITSIADTLERHGYNVQIINLAYQMLRNPGYDVEKVIARLNPKAFAIDLHWLPHAQGSLEIAKLVKTYHPATPVLMGGLSASYYHEELIQYPFVDFVIRGDSTEEPIRQLMRALTLNEPFENIPNLTWKKPDGSVAVNPLTFVPDNLDPGCLAFEYPEKYGYKKFCHTLEDHRRALTQPTWKHILSFETDAMTREEIVEATYAAADRLNQLKYMYGLIDGQVYLDIKYRITKALETIKEIDRIMLIPDNWERRQELDKLKERYAR